MSSIAYATTSTIAVEQDHSTQLKQFIEIETLTLEQKFNSSLQEIELKINTLEQDKNYQELFITQYDDRVNTVDWWMAFIGIVLSILGILTPIFVFSYKNKIDKNIKEYERKIDQMVQKGHETIEKIELSSELITTPDTFKKEKTSNIEPKSKIDELVIAAYALNTVPSKAINSWEEILAYAITQQDKKAKALAYFYLGYMYNELQQYSIAIHYYTKAIEIKPDFHQAYYNRGVAYAELGEYDRAIADYTTAIEITPDFHEAYYNRGNAYAKLEEYDLAIADYTKAIELKPDDHEAYTNRGIVYGKLGKYDTAIADYTKAIEITPDFHEAYTNRGIAYAKLEEYDTAIADYTKAIELKPDDHEAYYNRGNAYYNLEKYDLAIADYTTAIELKPDFHEAYTNRGVAYAELGKYEQAIADIEHTCKLRPELKTPEREQYLHSLKEQLRKSNE